jgi:hypothetical protein
LKHVASAQHPSSEGAQMHPAQTRSTPPAPCQARHENSGIEGGTTSAWTDDSPSPSTAQRWIGLQLAATPVPKGKRACAVVGYCKAPQQDVAIRFRNRHGANQSTGRHVAQSGHCTNANQLLLRVVCCPMRPRIYRR